MEKIDSRRILTDAERRGKLCPYLTKRGADVDSTVYCMAGACMAWRWQNDEPQYRVKLKTPAPDLYCPLTYWMSKDEADYYEKTGYYEIEASREPAGWCGYKG